METPAHRALCGVAYAQLGSRPGAPALDDRERASSRAAPMLGLSGAVIASTLRRVRTCSLRPARTSQTVRASRTFQRSESSRLARRVHLGALTNHDMILQFGEPRIVMLRYSGSISVLGRQLEGNASRRRRGPTRRVFALCHVVKADERRPRSDGGS